MKKTLSSIEGQEEREEEDDEEESPEYAEERGSRITRISTDRKRFE